MTPFALSNLQVRSNLLPYETCQQDIFTCSVFELRDAKERVDFITQVPKQLKAEWEAAQFWGGRPPPVSADWPTRVVADLAALVAVVEESPTEEAAFEALVLARLTYADSPDAPGRELAADWDRRVRGVLARPEFALTADIIEDRLASVLGRRLAGPPAVETPVTQPRPTATPRKRPAPATEPAPKHAEPPAPVILGPAVELFAPLLPAASPPPDPAPAELPVDLGLDRVTRAWATLPEHVRKCVLMLIDAAEAAALPR